MVEIERVTAERLSDVFEALVGLLQNVVDDGAAVGFLPPLDRAEAEQYWQEVAAELRQQRRAVLVAHEAGSVLGSVQLAFSWKPNAPHRAEVQKLLVHTSARRQGVGRSLLTALEAVAHSEGRSLLVLDTRQGDLAERLYRQQGYLPAGSIPHYARSADGSLHATVFFYRILSS